MFADSLGRIRCLFPRWEEKDGRGHSCQAGRVISLGLVALAPPSSTRRSQCPTMPQCKSMARVEPLIGPSHVFGQASGSLGGRTREQKLGACVERGEEKRLLVFLAACPAAHCKDHARRLPCRALQRPGPPGASRRPRWYHCVCQCVAHLLLLLRATTVDASPRACGRHALAVAQSSN